MWALLSDDRWLLSLAIANLVVGFVDGSPVCYVGAVALCVAVLIKPRPERR